MIGPLAHANSAALACPLVEEKVGLVAVGGRGAVVVGPEPMCVLTQSIELSNYLLANLRGLVLGTNERTNVEFKSIELN